MFDRLQFDSVQKHLMQIMHDQDILNTIEKLDEIAKQLASKMLNK